jgi:starch-binding outer membrane protein, SusD/RagB family
MNFSKSIIFKALALVSFGMSSCEKFLDVKPKGVDIIRTTDQYNGLFNNPNLNTFLNVRNQPGSITLLLGSAEMPLYMGDDVYSSAGFLNAIPNVAFQNGFKWEADLYLPTDEPNEWGAFYNQLYPYNLVAAGVLESEGGTEIKRRNCLLKQGPAGPSIIFWLATFLGSRTTKRLPPLTSVFPLWWKPILLWRIFQGQPSKRFMIL